MTSTLTKPSASGSAAAASEPKTTSRIIATIGKPVASALREVPLGDFLHPGPDRRLADQVGGDAGAGAAGVEVVAQGRGRVDQLVGGLARCAAAAARRRSAAAGGAPAARAAGGRVTSSIVATSRRTRADGGGALGGARAGRRLQQHRDPVRLGAEVLLQRFADRHRLAAGNVEAAAGQVFGLVRGEGQRADDDRDPDGRATQRRRRPSAPASRSSHRASGWSASLCARAPGPGL